MKKNSKARWLAIAVAASCAGCATGSGSTSPGYFASWTNPFSSQVAKKSEPRKDGDDELRLENKIPPKSDFFIAAGALAESRGDNDTAIAQYQQAISKDPKNVKAHLHLARLHDRLQRYPEAEAAYGVAVSAAPNNPTPLNDFAMCLARQRRYDESIDQFQRAIALQRHNALYRNNIAEVLVLAGRPREAFDHLSAVHSVAESHYNLAMLLRRNGELEPARQQMVAAMQVDPALAGGEQFLAELGNSPRSASRPIHSSQSAKEVAAPRHLRAQVRSDESEQTQAAPLESDPEAVEQPKASPPGDYYDGVEQGAATPAEVLARKPKTGRKSASELRSKINDASAKLR